MRPAWRFLSVVGLGAQVLLSASCELVLGIHEPPKLVDAGEPPATEDTQATGEDAGGAPGNRDAQKIGEDTNGAGGIRDTQKLITSSSDRDTSPPSDADALAVARADATPQPDPNAWLQDGLVLHYKFDDPPSKTAIDSACWRGTPRNASLVSVAGGAATYSDDRQVGTGSLELTADNNSMSGGYATSLPSPGLRDLSPSATTIAAWVFLGTEESRGWQRLFDFGATTASGVSPSNYIFLTPNHPNSSDGNVRFTMSRDGYNGEQFIDGTNLSPLTWHHIAVVLPEGSPYTGRLYVDGVIRGVNANMTLHPSDIGATDLNFIGRSQFSVDPTFVGKIDDFRIYDRALSEDEISRLMKVN